MVDLSVDLGFLKLKNPVLAASGTFGYGLEFAPYLDLEELGGFVVKGLYYGPREGNPPPRLVETPSGLINAIGLQGIGVEAFVAKVLPKLKDLDTAVIVNVCGEAEEEYIRVVEFLNGHDGIAAFELNISCPNVRQGGACPALDPRTTFRLVKAVKRTSRLPIITKLSPNVTSVAEIAAAAEEAGADAISLVNTFLAMSIDVETRRPKLANVFGGLSGPAIRPIALRMVYQVVSRIHVPVIGIGGISSGADALEFLLAGARAVEVGTASFVDPDASIRIIREIGEFCERHGIRRVEELIGKFETNTNAIKKVTKHERH
jgi:dihydroorotate dehydrogenase (NAD+) catalytic subunit